MTQQRSKGIRARRSKPRRRSATCTYEGCRRPPRALDLCGTHLMRRAERAVGEYVKRRDMVCVRCGSPWDLEWAHIIGRGASPFLKFDPDNAVALCHGDHVIFTKNPTMWDVFVAARYPGRLAILNERSVALERAGGHVDLAAVIAVYEGKAA